MSEQGGGHERRAAEKILVLGRWEYWKMDRSGHPSHLDWFALLLTS